MARRGCALVLAVVFAGLSQGAAGGAIATVSFAASAVRDPLDAVRHAIARGEKCISVPADRYYVDPKDGSGNFFIEIKGLRDTVIDFGGADLIGKVRTRFLNMEDCTNVTIKGFSLDFDPLPYTQGIIRSVDKDGTWDVEIVDGYPDVEATDGGNEPIDAHDPFWPIQVYDGNTHELKNPMRFRDGVAVVRTAPGRFRISGGLNRKGNVGDVAVWSVRESRKVANECIVTLRTKNCRFEDVTFYATPHGRIIDAFCSSNSYINCRMIRRPPEKDIRPRGMPRLRSGNHDFIIAKCGVIGPQIIGCTAEYHCDDCVNISGMYCLVTEVKGRELRVLKDWFWGAGVDEGDDVQIMFPDGTCPPDAKVVSVRPDGAKTAAETKFASELGLWPGTAERMGDALAIILDREIDGLKPGAIIMSENKCCNGFLVKGCRFGSTRARGMLIKASRGKIDSCEVDRPVCITTEYEWLSGGCSSDLEFTGNRFMSHVNIGGTVCRTVKGKGLPASAHRNLVFRGNFIKEGVVAMGCTGLDLRGNRIDGPVTTRNCEDVKMTGEMEH